MEERLAQSAHANGQAQSAHANGQTGEGRRGTGVEDAARGPDGLIDSVAPRLQRLLPPRPHLPVRTPPPPQVCNHPFLIPGADAASMPVGEGEAATSLAAVRRSDGSAELIEASGKLEMLDRLLRRLHPRGHRAVVFSQFTSMLDVRAAMAPRCLHAPPSLALPSPPLCARPPRALPSVTGGARHRARAPPLTRACRLDRPTGLHARRSSSSTAKLQAGAIAGWTVRPTAYSARSTSTASTRPAQR